MVGSGGLKALEMAFNLPRRRITIELVVWELILPGASVDVRWGVIYFPMTVRLRSSAVAHSIGFANGGLTFRPSFTCREYPPLPSPVCFGSEGSLKTLLTFGHRLSPSKPLGLTWRGHLRRLVVEPSLARRWRRAAGASRRCISLVG